MNKCDIKIMATKWRRENVLALCDQLGLDESRDVFYDDRPNGGDAMYTAEKAWLLPSEEGVTHRLLLQDNAIVNPHLAEAMDRIVNELPDALVTLCTYNDLCQFDIKPTIDRVTYVWLKNNCMTGGKGLCMPLKHIDSFVQWRRSNFPTYPHDDAALFCWCQLNEIDRYCIVPNLVSTHPRLKSLLKHYYKKYYSKCFYVGDISRMDFRRCEANTVRLRLPIAIDPEIMKKAKELNENA